jgi:hypothetical protein
LNFYPQRPPWARLHIVSDYREFLPTRHLHAILECTNVRLMNWVCNIKKTRRIGKKKCYKFTFDIKGAMLNML